MVQVRTLALMALALASTSALGQPAKTTVLTGGMLISGLSVPPLHNARVVIQGERVVAVGPASEVAIPAGAEVIDTSGQTMLPGLIDAHAHLFMVGFGDEAGWFKWLKADGRKYSIEKVMELSAYQLLMSGVTSAIDLGGNPVESISLRNRINKGEVAGPRLQVSGPLVTRRAFGGFPAEASAVITTPKEGAETVDRLFKMGVDVIKAHAGLTREDYFAIVKAAHANRIKVHAHLYAEADVRNAYDAGVDVFQHMGSAGGPTYDPELVRTIAESNRPVVLTAAHRSWIYPDTVAFPARLQDPVLKSLFPADIWAAMQESFKEWPAEGHFAGINRQVKFRSPQVRQLIESNALMGVGTDSGTPMNFNTDGLVREMKVLVDEGLSPLEVIADTTRVNARIMGQSDVGTIEPGKRADIITVPGDPVYHNLNNLFTVQTVIKNGVTYKKDGVPTIKMPE
ncbi:amidohydrolase family protein [Polymorphobacter multimanifer]|uniref:Imidazolonepropionase-like amidohydrolase n=1 Tax=Polymorphobacter multimanifer TaxID=1070431 RepID=A0A841LDK5_9SPHN|nr:amidohydrolase family protein [Polymorphobacter multimanifer]MBB6229093.1 imidazolonepropionase-like amidohydrolase [Polymorphobacter multimanifer]